MNDKMTERHKSDYKGRLKLSACEPMMNTDEIKLVIQNLYTG